MSAQQRMSTNVNRGLAWLGMASSLVGILDLVAILIILNNWVSTEQYGIATKCVWIFPVLDQATDLGLSAAVIQRDDHTSRRISTVFWINLTLSCALFALVGTTALPIATHFYGHAIVGWMLIAYGGKLIMQNGYFIPMAMMKRELRFKELAVLRIIANVVEFTTKVGFAWAGLGIWCFVLGPLCRTATYVIGCQILHPYRPRAEFSLVDARDYVTFGMRSSASQILFYFYTNVDYPIVGHFFGDVWLGLYRLAYEVVLEPVRLISNIVVDVAFPTFARLRGDSRALIAQFVSFTRLNLITVMSYSAVVFVAAYEVMAVMFPGNHGNETAIRILCIVAIFRSVSFVGPPLLDGVGRPERSLRYNTVATIAMPLMYILGAVILGPSLGFKSVAVAWAVGYPIAFAVLMFMIVHTINWSAAAYIRSVGGVALCMLGAGVVAAGVHHVIGTSIPPALRLLVTAIVVAGTSALLLAYTQGLTIKTAMASMREPPKPKAQDET